MSSPRLTRISRRAAILGGSATITGARLVSGHQATPAGTPVGHGATPLASPATSALQTGRFLLIADPHAKAVYVYAIPGWTLTGTLTDISFGVHGGSFLLPDGRLLFADLASQEIVALTIDADGTPAIVQRVPADLRDGVAWIVANDALTHIAFGSIKGSHDAMEPKQTLNIVDLKTFENTQLQFTMQASEEIEAWLLGDPLHVHVALGKDIQSFTWADLQAGRMTPLASARVGDESHGGLTDAARQRLYYVAGAGQGYDVVDVSSGKAATLTRIPWDLDGQKGGRNARPRVSRDGNYAIGVMTPDLADTSVWADTMVSNHIVNLEDMTATRPAIANGSFGYRWQLSDRYALWAVIGTNGSQAHLLDMDPSATTFGTSVGTIDLATPTHAPKPGSPWNEETDELYIMTTMTQDSAFGFATISGDGLIQVLDLSARSVIAEIRTPSPLAGGGYSCVVERGVVPVDLWGR